MSIHNLFNKIKSKIHVDKEDFMYLSIIVVIGIGSFGLGRLSASSIYNDNTQNSLKIAENTENKEENRVVNDEIEKSIDKRYVASKNGKMYYPLGCSSSSRIKKENQIWFATSEDAEKSGYTLSSTCK